MAFANYSTPLMALNGVVLDTETTGLDAAKARLLQIGALKLENGSLERAPRFESFINPQSPIPQSSTIIHGISDDMVANAPTFTQIEKSFQEFIGQSIIIGHTISYDMMIFKREYELSGLACPPLRTLDVRWLARLASPSLAHYDLDGLCKWLSIDVQGRHTAMGDALATAQVYLALVPKLRERGIRTLAQAEAASSQLAEQETRSAGGFLVVENLTVATPARTLARLDSFPYKHRVRDVMSAPPITALHSQSAEDAIHIFNHQKVSSIFVNNTENEWGIVTERDVLRLLSQQGASGLKAPLSQILTTPLQTVSENAFIYRAIGRIDRLNIRHLGVRDASGDLVGVVTPRNLLRQKAMSAIVLGDEIESAQSVAELGGAWSKLVMMAKSLVEDDVPVRTICEIISSEICVLTRKCAQMAQLQMKTLGLGEPPVPYCVMVLGSAGRGESLLAADQDNAIVYASGKTGGVEDLWFKDMATRMNAILDEVGVPFCNGGVMAKNAIWRHSLKDWKKLVEEWVVRQRPEDMLNVDIFFDGVGVHGDIGLANQIFQHAYKVAHNSPDFVKMLSTNMFEAGDCFTLFGQFKTNEHGRIDLKRHGLLPVVTSARLMAIKYHILECSTPARLHGLQEKGIGSSTDIDKILAAHEVVMGAMLVQQLADTEQGIELTPLVNPERLSKAQKHGLKEALRDIELASSIAKEGRV